MRHFRKARLRAGRGGFLCGLTPENQENRSGIAVHPRWFEEGKSRKARMKFIAPSGRSDRLRPFPHVLCKSCPLFLSLSTRFDEIRGKIGWQGAERFLALAELTGFLERFQSSRALCVSVKGGVFSRKMPLGIPVPGYSNSGTAVGRGSQRCREEGSSEKICPSRMCTTRCAKSAISASCVTSTIVLPRA